MVGAQALGVASRRARALVCGAVTVSTAAAAHVVGGGTVVTTPGLLVLTAVTAGVAYVVLGGRASRARIVALVVGAQVALHVLLELGTAGAGRTALMDHAGHGPDTVAASGSWGVVVEHLAANVTTSVGLAMTVAHTVAAVLVALWLAAGEGLLVSLAALAGSTLAARMMRARAALAARPAVSADLWRSLLAVLSRQRGGRWHRISWVPLALVARRGPPSWAFAESH